MDNELILKILNMAWLFLLLAIACEVFATTCLKLADGWTKPVYLIGSAIGYPLAFFCFSLSLKQIEISVAYAVWSGIGVTGTSILGVLLFHEGMGLQKVICIALITGGIIGLNFGKG